VSFARFENPGFPAQKCVTDSHIRQHPTVKRVMASMPVYPGYTPRVEPFLTQSW